MTEISAADVAFRERCQMEGDLSLILCEHIWGLMSSVRLAGQEFEIVGCDEVPGYGDDEYAVLFRRKSDGKVFEAYIEPNISPARTSGNTTATAGED